MVPNHKYRPGSNIPKMIWLANGATDDYARCGLSSNLRVLIGSGFLCAGKPADGAAGGSVIIKADPHVRYSSILVCD